MSERRHLLAATELWKRFTTDLASTLPAALCGATLAISPGTVLAVVGQSGSGKSTLARCLAMQEEFDSGEITWQGMTVRKAGSHSPATKKLHSHPWPPQGTACPIQLVIQTTGTALNPRWNAIEIVEESLRIRGEGDSRVYEGRDMLAKLHFPSELLGYRPQSLSGGQRQRLALARALLAKPQLLILDEAFTNLETAARDSCFEIAAHSFAPSPFTCIVITHDIYWAEQRADQIAVMHGGKVVESGSTAAVLGDPSHAETKRLLNAFAKL